jgi:DnaJ-class molecular chaperone
VSCSLEQLFRGASKDLPIRRVRRGWKEDVTLHIDIAPGARAGTKYRFPQEGDMRRGCEPEEIVFVLSQLTHPRFVRDGDDLATTMGISLKESLCGVDRTVVGIDGNDVPVVDCRVLKPGTALVVAGQGMPCRAGGRGALRVKFDVEWPDELDEETKAVLESCLPDTHA